MPWRALYRITSEISLVNFIQPCFYFMVNLRRDPGRFFFYWLMNIWATLVMSHFSGPLVL